MIAYLRVIAVDFDGTLTSSGRRPHDDVLSALARVRQEGFLVIMVTGRILTELRADFPDVEDWVDLIVAENGCVLHSRTTHRVLAPPVDPLLTAALSERGISIRSGEVLLAGRAADRAAILEQVHHHGLDCQLVFNRSELMVLPAGVTKGTGLFEALGDAGVSRHSAVGVGDAENDHALLDVCEVGVAVANAVSSLKTFADVLLTQPNGGGIVELLDRVSRPGAGPLHSSRWQVQLGTTARGLAVRVPSSQLNVLICGPTSSGKSYVAGLFAERLIAQGYSVLVVDPEGDHQGLARLRGVVTIDGAGGLPAPDRVAAIFTQRFASVVLDLSQVPSAERHAYLAELTRAVDRSRAECGLPHWVISDEAHESATGMRPDSVLIGGSTSTGRWGSCLVTYRPELIDDAALAQVDAVIGLGADVPPDPSVVGLLAKVAGDPSDLVWSSLNDLGPGSAYLALRDPLGTSHAFNVGSRLTEHQRHLHKYTEAELPEDRWFYFRDGSDRVVAVARNIKELQRVLHECPDDVVAHHAAGHDLSRWLRRVFADAAVGATLEGIERGLVDGATSSVDAREAMLVAIRSAYRI